MIVEFVNYDGKKFKRIAKYRSYDSIPNAEVNNNDGEQIVSINGTKWKIIRVQSKAAPQLDEEKVKVFVEKVSTAF